MFDHKVYVLQVIALRYFHRYYLLHLYEIAKQQPGDIWHRQLIASNKFQLHSK